MLPLFHSFTGCDTVSAFSGKGKKSWWSVWKIFPEITETLMKITQGPEIINEIEVMKVIERFVVLLYDRTSSSWSVNETRRRLFSHKSGLENIPPTYDSLHQHVKRAVLQG